MNKEKLRKILQKIQEAEDRRIFWKAIRSD